METLLGLLPSSSAKGPVNKKIDYKKKQDKVIGARFLHECGKYFINLATLVVFQKKCLPVYKDAGVTSTTVHKHTAV